MEKKSLKQKKIPKRLQPILWSVDVRHLDIERDKGYIIHQIFAYGRMEDILWVFKTYPKKEIIEVFKTPYKDYFQARFHFVKNFLLGLTSWRPDQRLYVKNIPRAIG